jgi:DNA-binding NarL/FixJ family response regulator
VPNEGEQVKVMILDDHPSVREGIRTILDGSGKFRVVGLAATAAETRTALAELQASRSTPELLIVDINLTGQSGIDFVRETARSLPETACVMMSVSIRFDSIVESFAAGAKGYIGKDQDEGSMIRVLDAVARGEIGLESEVLRTVVENSIRLSSARMGLERSRYDTMTPREKEIFRLTTQSKSVREIAEELSLSVKTVENFRSAIFGKLAVQDRFELYRYALKIGVLEE